MCSVSSNAKMVVKKFQNLMKQKPYILHSLIISLLILLLVGFMLEIFLRLWKDRVISIGTELPYLTKFILLDNLARHNEFLILQSMLLCWWGFPIAFLHTFFKYDNPEEMNRSYLLVCSKVTMGILVYLIIIALAATIPFVCLCCDCREPGYIPRIIVFLFNWLPLFALLYFLFRIVSIIIRPKS